MAKTKLFISHSSQDANVVTAFVNFMLTIGLKSEDMICTSVPSTKIPNGEDIFDYLNKTFNEDINKMKESESIKNGINYADYKISHKDSAGVYTIEKYESVAYFMQFLAQMAAEGKKCIITGGEYLLTDVPVAFEDIKSEFMHYADDMLGEDDITSPHLPIGYCIISNRA